jgi:hypothetical protein
MAMTRTAMMLWMVLGVVTARSLPDQRFASLEGEMMQSASGFCARLPRHLSDFAEFDQPLADDGSSLQRFARAADCGDELEAEFVESAPELEAEYESEYAAPAPQPEVVFVEAPEEMNASELSEVDEHLADDEEATLCEEGLHPAEVLLAEGEVDCERGRPARQASLETAGAEKAEKVDKQEQEETETKTAT